MCCVHHIPQWMEDRHAIATNDARTGRHGNPCAKTEMQSPGCHSWSTIKYNARPGVINRSRILLIRTLGRRWFLLSFGCDQNRYC